MAETRHSLASEYLIYTMFTPFDPRLSDLLKERVYEMIKILFVCWGNICRSPMGEYILKDMIDKRGLGDKFYVESAATSTEELGNPVYPPARKELRKHGIDCTGHHARQVRSNDYDKFDVIIAMEEIHRRIMEERFFGGDPDSKIVLCMELADRPDEQVDDPWYTGRFEEVYGQLVDACNGLIDRYNTGAL